MNTQKNKPIADFVCLFVWRMISGFPLRTLRDYWIWFSRSSRCKCLERFIHWKITVTHTHTHTHTHFMVPASLLMVEIGVSSSSWSVVSLIWGQCAHSPILISPCTAIKGLLWLLCIEEYPVILNIHFRSHEKRLLLVKLIIKFFSLKQKLSLEI